MPTGPKLYQSNSEDPNQRDSVLAGVGKFLTLGETINSLHHLKSPDPCRPKHSGESTEELERKVRSLTEELIGALADDESMTPLLIGLGNRREIEMADRLQILALVAYREFAAVYEEVTSDSISVKACILFSNTKACGMLHVRQVLARLLEIGSLVLHRNRIVVCEDIRRWMSAYNIYAEHGLTQEKLMFSSEFRNKERMKKMEQRVNRKASIERKVKAIPVLTPREIFDEIGRHGYIGQEYARETVSLAAYRHVNRLRMLHLGGVASEQLPPRSNILLMGETGTGKTFLIRTLFEKILKLPTAISDATTMTEAGYVGDDVGIVLERLLEAATGDQEWAQCGISAIDEFDKIAGHGSNQAAFGGGGTRNDVSKSGVQRGLLKILEEDTVFKLPRNGRRPNPQRDGVRFATGNVLFIASGAFTGIDQLMRQKQAIGFGEEKIGACAQNIVAHLCNYGIERELLGRFNSIAMLDILGGEELRTIMERNTIARFEHELGVQNIELKVEPEAMDLIVEKARERGTGARGLDSELAIYLDQGCFHAYSARKEVKRLHILREDDDVKWDLVHAKKQQAS